MSTGNLESQGSDELPNQDRYRKAMANLEIGYNLKQLQLDLEESLQKKMRYFEESERMKENEPKERQRKELLSMEMSDLIHELENERGRLYTNLKVLEELRLSRPFISPRILLVIELFIICIIVSISFLSFVWRTVMLPANVFPLSIISVFIFSYLAYYTSMEVKLMDEEKRFLFRDKLEAEGLLELITSTLERSVNSDDRKEIISNKLD